jgi:steroid 5-alpha reductase family enzyme
MTRTVVRVALATLGFAVVHSLLASETVKTTVERRLGGRLRDGAYRFFYMQVTFASLAALILSVRGLPDRVLYSVPKPWSWLMRLAQLFGIALIMDANRRLGLLQFSGVKGLVGLLSGRPVEREPAAQGPLFAGDLSHRTGGAYRVSRHPQNLGPTLVVCLQPTMTGRLLTFAVVGSAYSFLGSLLEERRARAANPEAYDRYRSRVPFFFPRPGRGGGPPMAAEGFRGER